MNFVHVSETIPRALAVAGGVLVSNKLAAPAIFLIETIFATVVFLRIGQEQSLSRIAVACSVTVIVLCVVSFVHGRYRQSQLRDLVIMHRGLVCTECGHPHDRDEDVIRCPECGAELSVVKARAAWAAAIKGADFQTPPPLK